MAVRLLFVFVALLVVSQIDLCGAIKIAMTPSRFTGEKEKTVKVSCKLDEAETSAKEIMVLKIAKKGEKAIVIIHPNNTISYVNGKKADFTADGKITDPVAKSYLNLVIKKPDVDDTGSYTCNIYYMDESGTLVEDKASAFLTVDDPEVKNFKIDIKYLKDKLKSVITKMKNERTEFKNTISTIESLVEKTKKSEADIQKIKVKAGAATPIVAFSATNPKHIKPSTGQHLVFSEIITQIGAGYNTQSGVFRAPVGGLYTFSLLLKTNCITCYIRVQLLANAKVLFRLKVGTYHDENQGFASAVVQLKEGDKVYPYVDFADGGLTLTPNKLSVFSGHLINKYNGV